MMKNTIATNRFDWRGLLFDSSIALAVCISIAVFPRDIALFLNLIIIAPALVILTFYLPLYAIFRKGRRNLAPVIPVLCSLWLISTSVFLYNFKHSPSIRTFVRWSVLSPYYKYKVLAQPAPFTGDLKHIEWESWGFAGAGDTLTFLVYNPTDSLSDAARSHSPGKYNGIPCEVPLVTRLESQWYTVLFYTDEDWGQCDETE